MLSWVETWTFLRHNELRGSERSHESMYRAMNVGRQYDNEATKTASESPVSGLD